MKIVINWFHVWTLNNIVQHVFDLLFCFEGKCAYYNTYQEGNIDQKPCLNSTTLVCPESAYFSIKTLNCEYVAKFFKKFICSIQCCNSLSTIIVFSANGFTMLHKTIKITSIRYKKKLRSNFFLRQNPMSWCHIQLRQPYWNVTSS